MDIKQAIERVARLGELIENIEKLVEGAKQRHSEKPLREITTQVYVNGFGSCCVFINRDAAIDLMLKTKSAYESERAALRPVIDMANAALKGIGA